MDTVKLIQFLTRQHLVSDGVFADKDKEDEAASEKVDTADDSEDNLRVEGADHVVVVPVHHMVHALHYPGDAHHNEQLTEQEL